MKQFKVFNVSKNIEGNRKISEGQPKKIRCRYCCGCLISFGGKNMYVTKLNGALPILWKTNIIFCPSDCGGERFDEIEYIPICPKCNNEIENSINYCTYCGQKLWKKVKHPEILDE